MFLHQRRDWLAPLISDKTTNDYAEGTVTNRSADYRTCNVIAQILVTPNPSFKEVSSSIPTARVAAKNIAYIRSGKKTLFKVGPKVCSISGGGNFSEISLYIQVNMGNLRNAYTLSVDKNKSGRISKVRRHRLGEQLLCKKVVVKNIVTDYCVESGRIPVVLLSMLDKKNTNYNPTVYPGCVVSGPHGWQLIFYGSGHVICTGLESLEACEKANKLVKEIIDICRILERCTGNSSRDYKKQSFDERIEEYYDHKSNKLLLSLIFTIFVLKSLGKNSLSPETLEAIIRSSEVLLGENHIVVRGDVMADTEEWKQNVEEMKAEAAKKRAVAEEKKKAKIAARESSEAGESSEAKPKRGGKKKKAENN